MLDLVSIPSKHTRNRCHRLRPRPYFQLSISQVRPGRNMPLQQISVSPLDWTKERTNANQQRQKNLKLQDPVFTTSGLNPLERCPSQTSTLSNNNDICRICHCESEEDAPLIAPCYCAGSLRYVHQACLQQWIKSSDIRSCELCKFQFVMQSKLKPFSKWESLEMNGVERRKLLCSVTFHAVALTCVVWSLYVLVDRTIEEIHRGLLEWPFWTKLIVVAIGFAGGVVFMYIQCKAYLHLCRRWRAFNRVIYVQNAPEKVALPPAAPVHPPKLVHQDSGFATETCCGVVSSEGARGHRMPEAMIINMDAARDAKTSLGSPTMARAKGDYESGNCLNVDCETLPEECKLGLGDTKVIVGTSSGTNFYVDAEDVNRTLHFNDNLPVNDDCLYEEQSPLRNTDPLHSDEERSRLLGDKIVKAGGFQLLATGTRQTSQSDDKISKNLSVASCLSSSSSEDSFKSLSIQLLQNQKPQSGSDTSNTRPWTSLNSCSTWIEKPLANSPQENTRPKSSQGSQSPLLTTVGMSDETK